MLQKGKFVYKLFWMTPIISIYLYMIYICNVHLNDILKKSIRYNTSQYKWDINDDHHTIKKSRSHEEEIQEKMDLINKEQHVNNQDIFDPMEENKPLLIIVVQTHNRSEYLQLLINSLSKAEGINQTLIIFSHDLWDDTINKMVKAIHFAKTLQIFFPFSIQTHPNVFPGTSPNDCPRDIGKDEAKRINCNNAEWPDQYGHYREAHLVQVKHHWWWKANHVFDQLQVCKNYDGPILLLEEDLYVTVDFLNVLATMEGHRNSNYPNYDFLCIGENQLDKTKKNYQNTYNKVILTHWSNPICNWGMAFNRNVWTKLQACYKFYCMFDEYDWDWSILHVSTTCLKEKLKAMIVMLPRVFHIGECGIHFKKTKCDIDEVKIKINKRVKTLHPYLHPSQLIINKFQVNPTAKIQRGYGGWADKRDQLLCLNISNTTFLEHL